MIVCKTLREIMITAESLYRGLNEVKPGKCLSNISHATFKYVEANGFSIVREYVGRGVGKDLHGVL
jgi:methionyl aminopeptidase